VHWPEQDLPIVLVGTRGEVPIVSQDKKKPILDAVPPGKIVLGYQLHRLLSKQQGKDLRLGDSVKLKGKTFLVHKLHEARGDRDDITAWIHLNEAQDLLGKQGLINGMLALGCNCSADRLGIIRAEIEKELPDTQVEEFQTKATARAEARTKVEAEGQAALECERKNRELMREEKEAFAAILIPAAILGCCLWLGLLAWLNVLERETEIGLYRALGLRSVQLFTLFIARAVLVGLLGAVFGCLAAIVGSVMFREDGGDWTTIMQPLLFAGVILAAPLISALACWIPSLLAVRRDPAVILQKE
jgi:putative ABC transport system permease protein